MGRWTPQQEAVFEAVAGGEPHLAVEAVAGAGKTSVTVEGARRAPGRVGFVAFNKHIAQELQRRLGGRASASTLHGLGFSACRKIDPACELDEGKLRRLLERLRPRWFYPGRNGGQRPGAEAQAALQLARLAKYTLCTPGDHDALDGLVEHYGVDVPYPAAAVYQGVAELLHDCQQETDRVDFDDMVWLPVRKDAAAGDFDTLFVDEAQDLSRVQQALARRAGRRLVVTGDRRQAVYGFSGSDCEALPRLQGELAAEGPGCVQRPLTVTFRCPAAHVALARKVVPEIEPAAGAVAGVVLGCDPDDVFHELLPGDLAVCRCNAPLVDLAYRFVTRGVPAVMRGRDIGKGMLDLVERLKPADPADLARKLADYEDRERARLERRDAPESQLQSLEDRCLCLAKLCSQVANLADLRAFVTRLFSDDGDGQAGKVVLSSVHRAKGLEADRVVIVAPEKLPLVRRDSKPWEVEQEMNLLYIALTRARRELVFAGDVPAPLGACACDRSLFLNPVAKESDRGE